MILRQTKPTVRSGTVEAQLLLAVRTIMRGLVLASVTRQRRRRRLPLPTDEIDDAVDEEIVGKGVDAGLGKLVLVAADGAGKLVVVLGHP